MNTGDTAWVLTSAALVLLMTPGLAFFYGGMVRAKSVLNMLMMSIGGMAVVGVLWVLFGYSLAFGRDVGGGFLGSPTEFAGLAGLLGPDTLSGSVPTTAFVAFQAMFAVITVALVSGAVADRARFGPWLAFAALWAVFVYFPVAHWVFDFDGKDASGAVVDPGGWIANRLLAVDFAGGTAVHVNAGAAGLALALVLGRRVGWPREPMKPHNLPLVVLGAGLLWFGWFGFNAGSALAANATAGVAFVNTFVAACAALLTWLLVERLRDGHATTLGAASGVVAGLVAITPACHSVTPVGAVVVGGVSGALCALAVSLKYRWGFDDSLDVVGVHLVGGLTGTLLIGLVASDTAPAKVNGLFSGGGLDQLWRQAVGALAVLAYSFALSLVLALLVRAVLGFRVSREAEIGGIDEAEHAETAYDFGGIRSAGRSVTAPGHGRTAPPTTTSAAAGGPGAALERSKA
ncbi:ammonium transporter [Streptoalloteichus tenebrarius]|uniref:Ammonium transporter n=1 Tax=Streptoalloteichus tenebrarius (strain ATCC 17920 / DSM 40477 / JCM 4838 / CBS 697.72 / NBRC 16177 / NCIMB 11028 / NRRL B-12390 / A12253. 1 / ISP 5477) TaxID=1933 RepID=A0ABT1I3Q5_STRSD|nr:ammonium transporter [Streptoalloteichus tenebrarius]MCP2262422.1 ammonium transporter [Streptoalloteichus tenebrarius]BFF03360.1 ammonium transporter [Streptoalloteichus tenebrarius]